MYFGSQKLWCVTGLSKSRTFVPVHKAVDILKLDVIEILPIVHALKGCDPNSAIASKKSALRVAKMIGYEYLHSFGNIVLTDHIITNDESFLVKCISPNFSIKCFDELRHETYYDNLEKFPPTSESIRQHIKREYLHCYLWFHSSFTADVKLNLLYYSYVEDDNEHLIPPIISGSPIPDYFPIPCNCLKRMSLLY